MSEEGWVGLFPETESLSGDRMPLLYRASFDPDRYHPAFIVRDVESGLPDVLNFLITAGQAKSLETLVNACINYIGLDTGSVNSAALLHWLYQNLCREDDAEGCVVSSALFARIQDPRVASLPTRLFLVEIARRYLDSTSYLVGALHQYAKDAIAIGQMAKSDSILLFMRDALFFWPSLRALQRGTESVPLNFMVYSRPLRDGGQTPLLFHEYRDGLVRLGSSPTLGKVLILDVGLYGSLISDLYHKGHFSAVNTVYFFGSRNPHLPGFLNYQVEESKCAQLQEDPNMVVRYVDIIECLLKPFQLRLGADRLLRMELGDPISLICSVAFMWAVGRFSDRQRGNRSCGCRIPIPSANSWYLPKPIPAWSKAGEFIEQWSVEKMTPTEQVKEWQADISKRERCDYTVQ